MLPTFASELREAGSGPGRLGPPCGLPACTSPIVDVNGRVLLGVGSQRVPRPWGIPELHQTARRLAALVPSARMCGDRLGVAGAGRGICGMPALGRDLPRLPTPPPQCGGRQPTDAVPGVAAHPVVPILGGVFGVQRLRVCQTAAARGGARGAPRGVRFATRCLGSCRGVTYWHRNSSQWPHGWPAPWNHCQACLEWGSTPIWSTSMRAARYRDIRGASRSWAVDWHLVGERRSRACSSRGGGTQLRMGGA